MMQAIMKKIFGQTPIPPDLPESEFNSFVEKAITNFEHGGFLEQTKLEPLAEGETDFLATLRAKREQLVIVKYWKHGCLPCLSMAEMYKEAEAKCAAEGLPVYFCSIDVKAKQCLPHVRFENVEGTPTVKAFHRGCQLGDEITSTSLPVFMEEVRKRLPGAAPAEA